MERPSQAQTAAQYKIFFEHFTKKFGDLLVLNNITFGIEDGEFLVIVGPTGCGKTTLAKLLIGLLEPTQGDIFINGKNTSQHAIQENISVVFQEDSLLPWRSVRKNVQLPLEIRKDPAEHVAEKTDAMLNLLELQEYGQYMPAQLSRGMRQRVAIARSYVTDPSIIIMDEPFGHFDATSREHIEKMIINVWQKTKATILFVTHNIEEAVFLASRIIVLSQKPTDIKEVIPIHLKHPRSFTDPEFIQIRKKVTDLIKWW
ncbi:ATP-binding cassette domain-containing protein [candidate division KSB3 bacterium]|uniref:ATP-binding cassette domain-containing protein n=1 Tax=candidate division KSB3 bacterium TaxID=2044937 RepID=A0A9D5JVT8_9BACT|nr:ATP-binding cassette domain-containing protein [candidate division KSB3 bacterium]MBD3325075.1 ATP-binding cassette domain-containing protein [candidate division KSB3 bacterium]